MNKLLSAIMASTMLLSTATMVSAVESNTETLVPQVTKTLSYQSAGFAVSDSWRYYTGFTYGKVVEDSYLDEVFSSDHVYIFIINKNSTLKTFTVADSGKGYQYTITDSSALTTVTLPDGFPLQFIDIKNCQNLTALLIPGYPDEPTTQSPMSGASYWMQNCPNLVIYGQPGSLTEAKALEEGVPFRDIATYGSASSSESVLTYSAWMEPFIEFVSPSIMPDIAPENCKDPSNRGLIAQSVYNMLGDVTVDPTESLPFTDVGDYEEAIHWCYSKGIMSGTGESTFGTDSNVSREQFCLILKQMATVLEKTTVEGDTSSLESYTDGWSISSWAADGVAWAVANGLMKGDDNALNPHGEVTRTEVAVMLSQFSGLT